PMLLKGRAIGAIIVNRREPEPYTASEIALLTTFANQAVIAIENVRLFTELGARNRELTEALEQQTATSDVLKVISRSTFELEPVLKTLIENATRLCGAHRGLIFHPEGETFRAIVTHNLTPALEELLATPRLAGLERLEQEVRRPLSPNTDERCRVADRGRMG